MGKRKKPKNLEDNSQDLKIRVDEWKKKLKECVIFLHICIVKIKGQCTQNMYKKKS